MLAGNPFLEDSLLIGPGRRADDQQDRSELRLQHRRPPDLPDVRLALHAVDGLGGHRRQHGTSESASRRIRYFPIGARRRTSLGFRAQASSIAPTAAPSRCRSSRGCSSAASTACAASTSAPSARAIQVTKLVVGGNKSLLFNVEYLITIAGPVRLVLFYDAGQVRARGESFGWKRAGHADHVPRARSSRTRATSIRPFNPFLRVPAGDHRDRRASAFKTSTGAEIRFFMPVLNVPFRLIFAANPSRGGVLDNNLQPEKKWKFRFAVGSTF